jgi:hypothetical protein
LQGSAFAAQPETRGDAQKGNARPSAAAVTALVSAQLMEETWRAVGALSEREIRRRQRLCGEEQEELTGLVLGFTSNLPEEALGLALYAHFVVVEAFRRSGAAFLKIARGKIERAWKDNFGFINDLRAAGYTRSPFQLREDMSSEPAAMQYVIDALTEENKDDPVPLTDQDFWRVLQVLKTVTDCMHEASRTK